MCLDPLHNLDSVLFLDFETLALSAGNGLPLPLGWGPKHEGCSVRFHPSEFPGASGTGSDAEEVDEEREVVLRHVTTTVARSIQIGNVGAHAFDMGEGGRGEESHHLVEFASLPWTDQEDDKCAWKVNHLWFNSVHRARHWCTKSDSQATLSGVVPKLRQTRLAQIGQKKNIIPPAQNARPFPTRKHVFCVLHLFRDDQHTTVFTTQPAACSFDRRM